MLLRSVSLMNIRSYNDGHEIKIGIPEGTILFEGDVGSGKSTILYAIEFALFGLGEMSGSYLLSERKDEGYVTVGFNVDGQDYEVHRGLRRRKADVVQVDCHIVVDGEKAELSPADLKERVISILKFNEPSHPRAESMVYRFAVFTPQEQMKEILMKKGEDRLQVIRRVLGIQSYQTAADNADVVERAIRNRIRGLESASADLEEKERDRESTVGELTKLDSLIPRLQAEKLSKSNELEVVNTEWNALREDRAKIQAVVDGIPKLESSLARLEKSIRDENHTVERQRARLIDEYEPVVAEFESRVPPSLKSLEVVDAELTEQRAKRDGLKQEQAILELQLRETAELITRGVCPRCGQKISQDFTLRSSHLDGEFLRVKAEVAVLEEEVLRTAALSEGIRSYREDKEAYEVAKRRVSDLNEEISEASKRLKEAEAESEGLRRDLHHAEAEVEKADELSARIARAETRLARAQHEKDEAVEALIHAVDRRDEGRRKIESLEVDINRKKDAREKAKGLSGYVEWLSTFFTPTVLLIEKETMVQTNARFDHHFQRFFSALVDDPDLNVRVREDFSPVFERQGFDQDFDALSGGERTSVALAYRFALTTIAREDTGGQGELVILDEPTDGFSKEQVFKMRGLLEELKSRQVVLVSHERELEAMADSIFRVEKVNGTSKLTGT